MATTKKTSPARPVNPSTLEPRLREVEQRLLGLKAERTTYLYRRESEPEKAAEIEELLFAVDRETAQAERDQQNLQDLHAEASRRWEEFMRDGYLGRLIEDRDEVAALGKELEKLAKAMAQHIEALGPMLEQFRAIGEERSNLAWGVISAGTERNRRPNNLRQLATMGDGALAYLLAATLHRAGVGRLAPTANITVPPLPRFPGQDGWVGQPGSRRQAHPDRTLEWHAPDADYVALAEARLANEEAVLFSQMARSIEAVQEGKA